MKYKICIRHLPSDKVYTSDSCEGNEGEIEQWKSIMSNPTYMSLTYREELGSVTAIFNKDILKECVCKIIVFD